MLEKQSRLEVLDAMRGIAALLVVVFHTRYLLYRAPLVPSGYLAVDFFFMLSGFVVAQAYGARLVDGMTLRDFVKVRAIRLYPLFAIGFLFGVADAVRRSVFDTPEALSLSHIAQAMPFEALMLPSFVSRHLFVLNGPAWSLFFEMVINYVYAIVIAYVSVGVLVTIILASAVGLVLAALTSGSLDTGFDWATLPFGAFRVCFPFAMGVLISRLQLHRKIQPHSMLFILPVVALASIMIGSRQAGGQALYDVVAVTLGFPLIVVAGAACSMPSRLSAVAKFLGDTSYAIYVIHFPLLYMCAFALRRANISAFVWLPFFMVGLYVLSWALDKYYDTPSRNWLSRRFKPSKSLVA